VDDPKERQIGSDKTGHSTPKQVLQIRDQMPDDPEPVPLRRHNRMSAGGGMVLMLGVQKMEREDVE